THGGAQWLAANAPARWLDSGADSHPDYGPVAGPSARRSQYGCLAGLLLVQCHAGCTLYFPCLTLLAAHKVSSPDSTPGRSHTSSCCCHQQRHGYIPSVTPRAPCPYVLSNACLLRCRWVFIGRFDDRFDAPTDVKIALYFHAQWLTGSDEV